jgi:glutamate 5-kinase
MSAPSGLNIAKRLIVKIGSALLVDQSTGQIHRKWLDSLADDVAMLEKRGVEMVIVTSGAVAIGRRLLGLGSQPLRLEEKQAAAATGQIRLAHAYQETLARHEIKVAQVLLTIDDSESRQRYLNARNTLDTLIRQKAVPVINENDVVATQELRFGDNDRLAARVAQMIGADTLVLLSDIDGLYTADPRKNPEAAHIPVVREITPEVAAMAGAAGSNVGSGGMVTKIIAARICMTAGCRMVIAPGKPLNPLSAIENGETCTWFLPASEPRTARKRWIAGSCAPTGTVIIDDGAKKALTSGRSLLPAGVTVIEGEFLKGDTVLVKDSKGQVVARGLVAYPAEEARLIVGKKSGEFEALLGYQGRDELIHRDDLVTE